MIKSIFFVINTFSGLGGHYYSLVTTATALSRKYNVHIVNLGERVSPVIEKSGLPYTHVFSNFRNQLSVTRNLIQIISGIRPDVIHAFDQTSYMLSFHAAWIKKIPLVVTKCGGPTNPKYPYSNNLIVYTKEDLTFFNSRYTSDQNQVVLIPNRVIPFGQDTERISSLQNKLHLEQKRVVLRIGRIDPFYYETSKQCINLIKELHNLDDSFVLLFVGNIVDRQTMQNMLHDAQGCDFIHFVTDRDYTLNAKELIDIAEIVVGTGRGFMEACSRGKKMMAPNVGQAFPILVDQENFDKVFYYNFSERYHEDKETKIDDILVKLNTVTPDSSIWFERYFSYKKIEPLYTAFYASLKPTRYLKIFTSINKGLFLLFIHGFINKKR